MAHLTYAHLEILHHHLMAGTVWDGDQISKVQRNDLIGLKMLQRLPNGLCAITRKGSAYIFRHWWRFKLWRAVQGRGIPWGWQFRVFGRGLTAD